MAPNIPTGMTLTLVDPIAKCRFVYEPKEDVTCIEVALLMNLFFFASIKRREPVGIKHFIVSNGLQRHFVESEDANG